MQTFSAHNILLRAEMIAKTAGLKVMVSSPYRMLPEHYRGWKSYRNKEEIQFLHVLPCRCGFIRSHDHRCTCSRDRDLASMYADRNRRHFYEEKYHMALDISNIDLDEYQKTYNELKEKINKTIDLDVSEVLDISSEADTLLKQAAKRFPDFVKSNTLIIASAIEHIDAYNSKKKPTLLRQISKKSVLEALSYQPRF